MNPKHLLAALALCCSLVSLHAQAVLTGFTGGGSLERNDDDYSGAIALPFAVNFGGATYSSLYVSNNGYVTFNAGSGEYYPSPLGANYVNAASPGLPILAPFFSDVDTRDASSALVSWGAGTFQGRTAFAVTWPGVGEFGTQAATNLNRFQLLLVDRSDTGTGNFDIYFNYDSLVWDHEGYVAVGYHNGSLETPLYGQFPGSVKYDEETGLIATPGAFLDGGPFALAASSNLSPESNIYTAGRYLLEARNGQILGNLAAVPEPSTVALLALGGALLGFAGWRRRQRS